MAEILELDEYVFGTVENKFGPARRYIVGNARNKGGDYLVTSQIRFYDKDNAVATGVDGTMIKLHEEGHHRDSDIKEYWGKFVKTQDSAKNPVIESKLHPLEEIAAWITPA